MPEPILQYLWFVGSLPYSNPPSAQPPGWGRGWAAQRLKAQPGSPRRPEVLPGRPAGLLAVVLGLVGEDLGGQLLGVQELREAPHHSLHEVRGEDAAQLGVHAGSLLG